MNVMDIERGRVASIHEVGGRLVLDEKTSCPDRPSAYLGPGWVDVQVNGFAGHDVNDGTMSADGFSEMVQRLHETGVARFLPTVVTASASHMAHCLAAVHAACGASPIVSRAVAGVHLEGPFLSTEEGARGAHPREHLVPPDRNLFDDLQAASGGRIRLVTLAPETDGALDLIAYLASHGIVVALGHTLADGAVVREAIAAGATLSTHLGNGIPAILPRHPNTVWEQLADDRLFASAIFDGHHLPEAVMRVIARVKGPERLLLVSDAVAIAGLPPGVYESRVGGEVELLPSGRLTLLGTPYLAGSASSLLHGVNVALTRVGLAPDVVMAMVGRTPRRLLGLDDPEDWTVFDPSGGRGHVLAVAVGGELVVDRLDEVAS